MPASIIVDQAAKPPGVAGKAREDLDTGTAVTLTAAGGPFSDHLWEVIDKPIDVLTPVQSAAVLTAPTAATTSLAPIDLEGTYKIGLTVDSGSGLGANVDDITELTFYANLPANPLAIDPAELPRRRPAFRERTEHNVDDALFPAGNPRGYATEWDRWFAAINRMAIGKSFAWARVSVPGGGPASVVATGAFNVANVNRIVLGLVTVTFTRPLANANYAVIPVLRNAAGNAAASAEAVGGFTVATFDAAGAPVDADFSFDVRHRAV